MVKKEYILPKKVQYEGNITGADALLLDAPRQIHIGVPTKEKTVIKGCGYLLLDFGAEIRGGIRILCYTANDVKNAVRVRLRFGESVGEVMSELGEKGSCNDHAQRDFHAVFGGLSDNIFGATGFRFLRIDFEEGSTVELGGILAVSETLDLEAHYEYKGDDSTLREIYDVAKRTVDLCSAGEYVWDGVKRDRLVWIGDMHPEMLALTTLYGRVPMMDNSINFMRETTPIGNWMCTLATYSAWWLIVLADYYKKTDCRDLVMQNLDYAVATVNRFLECIGDDGSLGEVSGSLVDWPTRSKPDEDAGVRAILIIMAKKATELFDAFGVSADGAKELLERLMKKPIVVTHAMQVAGLKYMALGELEESDIRLMGELGAHGMSTFMSYYILTAYAKYFGVDAATKIMKEYYGGMLSVGATTFWEDFHLEWLENSGRIDEPTPEGKLDIHGDFGDYCYKGYRHSLCHGWSAGILAFMKENGI